MRTTPLQRIEDYMGPGDAIDDPMTCTCLVCDIDKLMLAYEIAKDIINNNRPADLVSRAQWRDAQKALEQPEFSLDQVRCR